MATASSAYLKLLQMGTKIVAVGRNYAAHAKELGNAVPKEPVLFLKPTSSYLENGGTIEVPHPLESLHHEVELAVVIGQKARDVPEAAAMDYVGGYAVALDMTAREIQASAKSAGLPWTVSKGQDTFTPISSVLPTSMVSDPDNLELWLKVDGEIRQKGSTKEMIFKIPFLISHISSIMTLLEGDVILTGWCCSLPNLSLSPMLLASVALSYSKWTALPGADGDGVLLDGLVSHVENTSIHMPEAILFVYQQMAIIGGRTSVGTGTPPGVGPVKVGQKITAGITDLLDVHFNVEKRRRPESC